MDVAFNDKLLEEAECFKNLGSKITVDGGIYKSEVWDQLCKKGVGRNKDVWL